MTPPRVFISYAWESDQYRDWVERLARRLRQDGVDARLDRWDLTAGESIASFMNSEVRHADKVLVLCSPKYREKVHLTEDGGGVTGAGWEAGLLADQIFAKLAGAKKSIPVLTRGRWQEAAPDFMVGQVYVDLSADSRFEEHYVELLRQITGQMSAAPPLGSLPDVRPPDLEPLTGEPEPAEGVVDTRVRFTLGESAEGLTVTLQADGSDAVTAPFGLNLVDGQACREIAAIEAGQCTVEDIQNLGNELWTQLRAGAIEEAVARTRHRCRRNRDAVLQVRLELPPSLEHLPWEALFDFDEVEESSLATSPVTSVVRGYCGPAPPQPTPRGGSGPLKILMVIPSGSGLSTSTEWEKIQQSIRAAKDGVEIECLDGKVTANRFAETLSREEWDIVHFIGHGKIDETERVRLRLSGEGGDDNWLPAQMFAREFLRTSVQLVVLNCCHTGATERQQEADGEPLHGPSGLGAYMLKARVPAVVVMRYEIHDNVAADFSRTFYHELLIGPRRGRVDLAVQEGRATLQRTYVDDARARSYITPVLYLAEGREQLFDLEAESRVGPGLVTEAVIDPRIDAGLVDALTTRRCLPILGPGILAAAAVRDGPLVPGPSSLARLLGEGSDFPDCDRLTALLESSAAWMTPVLLERVCQHFACVDRAERAGLNEAIQKAYRQFHPPSLLEQIAQWPAPGLVYTHIDGLLEQSLVAHRGRDLRVVQPENLGGVPAAGELVLLNLRGNYTAPHTMVLTETDEDRVLDLMPEISSFVEDVMNAVPSCTLLFLGVSPRDGLVRALSRRLLRHEMLRNRGTAFFVGAAALPADVAYWREFAKLEWLDLDVETVVRGLSIAAARSETE